MANPIGHNNDRAVADDDLSLDIASTDANNGVVHVSTPTLLLAAVPLLCIAYIGHRFDLGLENTLIVGIIRSFVQLMTLGLILQPIFLMGMDWPWLVGLYVLFMILVATNESMGRRKYSYHYQPLMTFLALLLSVTAVGTFAFLFIIRPNPRWNPQYVIPICGMLMGNCISGVSLTVNNLSTQIMEGGRREIELYLSFGASGWESVGRLVKGAVRNGMTPFMNSLNVMGLVSIPGMMTGQILSGSPVTEAAHYQILIAYLIATNTFSTIFMNVFIVYRVAFGAGTHVLRTDRFIVVGKKKKKKSWGIAHNFTREIEKCFDKVFLRQQASDAAPDMLEKQPLSNHIEGKYGSSNSINTNRVQILTRQLASDRSTATPFFRISKLQFSVPLPPSTAFPSRGNEHSSLQSQPQLQQQRVLCTNLNASLNKGEIGIVKGPSGSGKSCLLRVLAGLTPMDFGDCCLSGLSLADCFGHGGDGISHTSMLQWRSSVRYVTQFKVDIPGTPRDFIHHLETFHSNHVHDDNREFGTPSEDTLVSQTILYLQHWGMGAEHPNTGHHYSHTCPEDVHHPYLDKEWKQLSGGESQRCILAIAMATRPQILLIDEGTSGLDAKAEKLVEKSVVDYVREHNAGVLWVTHDEDITERLLTQ
ncbi:hypothetical protein ACHAXR_013174 [Thalassiosira sp. AJA248-18]